MMDRSFLLLQAGCFAGSQRAVLNTFADPLLLILLPLIDRVLGGILRKGGHRHGGERDADCQPSGKRREREFHDQPRLKLALNADKQRQIR